MSTSPDTLLDKFIDYEKQLLLLQRDILESIANSNDHDQNLNKLCHAAEAMLPNSVASIMLYDKTGKKLDVRAAPSIPQPAIEQLNGLEPCANAGSCGTAVFSGAPVYVENTALDKRWLILKDFAEEHGIEACWSNPIILDDSTIIGSFALSSFETRKPSEFQKNLLSVCAHLAGLVIWREKMERRMWHHANLDPLTSLPNRGLFNQQLEHIVSYAKNNNQKAALLFIDIDNFKDINDSFGHAVGDKLLKTVSDAIKNSIRDGDVLARTGGDEFVLILRDLKSIEDANSAAKKILNAVRNHKFNDTIETTLSVGISVYPDDAKHPEELLRNADTAMYAAKALGKNNYYFYRPELTDEILEKLTVVNELRRAIHNNEFVLHFQPIYNANDRSIFSVEALIRWQHPERGLLLPDKFIPVAEEYGLIKDITMWVVSEACQTVKGWLKKEYAPKHLSINVSASDIDEQIYNGILKTIEQTNFPKGSFEIEITETMIMKKGDSAIQQLQNMHDQGISISLDDFGTGYSSLYRIHDLPIDKIKIDRDFIKHLPQHEDYTKLTKIIVDLARAFSLKVVAEGVETQEQYDYLVDLGCEYLQGYYLSEPLTAEELQQKFS